MGNQRKTKRAVGVQPDANSRLPETVTSTILTLIHSLPDTSRKTQYLKEMVTSKFVSSETAPADVRRARAIAKWLATERENEATNVRLLLLEEDYNILPRVTWRSFRAHVRKLISDLIGDTVPLEAIFGGFSGGASTSKSRTSSHPALKYLGRADITSAAKWWFDLLLDESPLWKECSDQLDVNLIEGNVLFTVLKSTEIDRCAAKEPDLNMYLQKGVGNYLRNSLRKVGINLNDQTRNQKLARIGSIDSSLATLDLSSASDSISYELVAQFMPECWFGLLADLRSPSTKVDGEWHKNEMFSSMGNGFTFELESLLFWAIAKTCRNLLGYRGVVSVYGDDIIVESGYAHDLIWVLGVLGFSTNVEKSFIDGPFRESCGGHFENGYDISPFFVRQPIVTVRDAIKTANHIREWAVVSPGMTILDPDAYSLWKYVADLVPDDLKGGIELGADYQLVSHDTPNKRLVNSVSKRNNYVGGYLLWLDTCGTRNACKDVIQTSERAINSSFWRKRRVRADGRKTPFYFWQEIG